MRQLTITRKKNFCGMLIPYAVFVSYPRQAIDPQDPDDLWEVPEEANAVIKNGETVTFPIREQKCSVVVWAQTSTGAACGPAYYLEEGTGDIALELTTQYSWLNGSRYLLQPAVGSTGQRRI